MNHTISEIKISDQQEVMNIFNYYIENSFAAFPDTPLPEPFFHKIMSASEGYPTSAIRDETGIIKEAGCKNGQTFDIHLFQLSY